MASIYRRPLIPNSLSPLEMFLLSADLDVVHHVLAYLPPADIFRLYLISHDVYSAIDSYVRRTWSAEMFFCDWFPPERWDMAREVMDKCGAVASGSAVLRYMARAPPYPGSDMDVFVPWWGLLDFGRFLRRVGYQYQPRAGSPFLLFDQAALTLPNRFAHRRGRRTKTSLFSFESSYEVFDFYIPGDTDWADEGLHVQVIAVFGDALEHVLSFHSTAVMNVVTGKFAASLFPRATFCDQVSFVSRSFDESYRRSEDWKQKYVSRGYEVRTDCSGGFNPTVGELMPQRFFGDQHTWVVQFDEVRSLDKRFDAPDGAVRRAVPNVPFEIILPSRGPVVVDSYMNIVRPFTVSAVAFASRACMGWPYGGTYETAVAFGA